MPEREISIGALWKQTSGAGKTYLSGFVQLEETGEKIRVVVFAARDKKTDKSPDFRMYKAKTKEEWGGGKEGVKK
jgi:uncharacterized protein (DUF736 family)